MTDKLEKKIQEMPELKDVKSSSKSGISIISVNLRDEYRGPALRPIWDSLRRKVDAAASELPAGTIGPNVNDEFGDVFGTVVSLTGEGYDYAELRDIADEVRNELLELPDVAKVDIFGAQDERIFVEFKPARLTELGLSPSQLQNILQTQNIVASGGAINFRAQRLVLEPTGNFRSVDDIRDALIRIPGTTTSVRLGDITHVSRGYVDPPRSAYHATGTPGLALAVSMRFGGNIITLGKDVRTLLTRLRGTYPWGINLELAVFQADDVQATIDGFTMSLLQAVGIVLLCMLLFLGLRTGLVVASLIPMAMASTMVMMGFFDMGLDKVSLAALIIALGLLVDNAVVMAEATMVYMEQGKARLEAAIMAANELRGPLLISSLTHDRCVSPVGAGRKHDGGVLGAARDRPRDDAPGVVAARDDCGAPFLRSVSEGHSRGRRRLQHTFLQRLSRCPHLGAQEPARFSSVGWRLRFSARCRSSASCLRGSCPTRRCRASPSSSRARRAPTSSTPRRRRKRSSSG